MGDSFMQPSRILLLAGAVTAGAISLAGLAYAGNSGFKTLTLQLPGGQVEQIELSGPATPQVAVLPAADPTALPSAANPFVPQDPFAQLEQISALLDQQAAAMMRAMQIMTVPPMPTPVTLVPAGFAPVLPGAGGASYSFVSMSAGASGACMQSVEITSNGDGAPKVVRHSAGNCGALGGGLPAAVPFAAPMSAPVPAIHVAPQPALAAPELIRVRDTRPLEAPHASQT
jgi:hypothetical protein